VRVSKPIPCDESLKALLRFKVCLWKDNDDIGADHMEKIGRRLIELSAREVFKIDWTDAPMKADAADFEGDVDALIDAAEPFEGPSSIICENYETAVAANAEYLKRPEIVERLLYTRAISLDVGGKHHGKTSNVRTFAMSIMRGLPIYGRRTNQGHVIYAASDDEIATTRMELLRMGWNAKTDPLSLVHINPSDVAKPEKVLEDIANLALRNKSVFIVLDMLFDFAGIKDEMSYAGTTAAVAKIQTLSDWTSAHVKATHHSPKYVGDAATVATSALGSQGIVARFSPITLTRKWAEGLYTVESTKTRDPRGQRFRRPA
jgi:hypothetical protein